MMRWHVLTVAAALMAVGLCVTPALSNDAQSRAKVMELIRESQELGDQGDYQAAMDCLLQALEIAPDNPSVHAHLGYLYEVEGQPLKALTSYGRLLELRPEDQYGRDRITHLFFGAEFPRRLRLGLLQFSPVSFVTDQCRIRPDAAGDELSRRIAYTTGVVFPEEMEHGGAPITVDIPSAGGQGVVGQARFNRVSHGYVAVPGSDEMRLTAMVHYPSTLLSQRRCNDYSALAERIAHVVAAPHCYGRAAYGLPQVSEDEQIVRVWMCEERANGRRAV
jgi:tetratricopeptide (TPR) repeat protein